MLTSAASPKLAFSTSASAYVPAVTQQAPHFKDTAVVNGEFNDDLGLFIIDHNGVIKHISINDLPVGLSVEETLRLVKTFQFVEVSGEICPANWKPDSPTMKSSPIVSKEYFEKKNNSVYAFDQD
uniref:thioredoxin-dependent peroxiredoxin n=1 Tax=Monodelphis domestica TaxID=13616 RepID=A0A5F8GRE5_MONDO